MVRTAAKKSRVAQDTKQRPEDLGITVRKDAVAMSKGLSGGASN